MSGRNLTSLNVSLTATSGPFATALKQAEGVAEHFGDKLKEFMLHPITLIVEALGAREIVEKISQAAERIDGLAKAADRLGVSTQSLAGMQHAAEMNEVAAGDLTTAMEKLTRKVQEAAAGNKAAEESIHKLGLRYSDLAAMRPDEQFGAVADAVNKLGTQGEKTAAVMNIFGRNGGQMMNMLKLGSTGLKEAGDQAEKFGTAISRVDAAKVEEAHEALIGVGQVLNGIFDQVVIRIAPFVAALAQAFTDSATQANGFGSTIDKVVNAGIWLVKRFADVWQGVTIAWKAGEIASMELAQDIVDMADAAIMAGQWIGEKFSATWDLVKSSAVVMGDALAVTWAGIKVPVAMFVQWTSEQFAKMLQTFGEGTSYFDAELGASMQAAGLEIGAATGAMGAAAKKELAKQVVDLDHAADEVGVAWERMFADVATAGDDTLHELSAQYSAQADKLQGEMGGLTSQGPDSEKIQQAADDAKAESEVKADARAKEIKDAQEQQDKVSQVNALGLRRREDERARWQKITESEQWKYTHQTITGMSSMFANLSTLQNTHSKRAQQVGRAAAKAKIVMDTASAAMGAYSAMAGIPYVGPVLGIAAAAAAIAAGAIQLSNVDSAASGSSGGAVANTATTNIGGIAAPNNGQTLVLQGDSFSADSLVKLFNDAKERGLIIEGVRRG